eukprot:SAG22_NODE_1219_length_5132_cov_2.957878_1_plen_120_part_00
MPFLAVSLKALKENESLFIVAVFEGAQVLAGCISGPVVLRELDAAETGEVVMYVVGVCLIVTGECCVHAAVCRPARPLLLLSSRLFVRTATAAVAEHTLACSCEEQGTAFLLCFHCLSI